MKNWKTTLAGISAIIAGVSLFFNHPDQINEAIASVVVGLGLIFAKDSNISGD